MNTKQLEKAIDHLLVDARSALDALDLEDVPRSLKTGIYLLHALLLMVRQAGARGDLDGIYRAFGAPGDWGYETELGAALAALYRASLRQAKEDP